MLEHLYERQGRYIDLLGRVHLRRIGGGLAGARPASPCLQHPLQSLHLGRATVSSSQGAIVCFTALHMSSEMELVLLQQLRSGSCRVVHQGASKVHPVQGTSTNLPRT